MEILPILMGIKSFLVAAWKTVANAFSALPTGVKWALLGLVVLALYSWWLNDNALNRGEAAQKRADQAEIDTLNMSVKNLQAGIDSANAKTLDAQKEAASATARANALGQQVNAQTEAARKHEALRGPGAANMNSFMVEVFP